MNQTPNVKINELKRMSKESQAENLINKSDDLSSIMETPEKQ